MGGVVAFLGLFCHQLPERSLVFESSVFPFCFRCAGLYLGLLSGYIFLALSGGWRRSLPSPGIVAVVSFFVVPFWVDGWGNTLRLWSTPGEIRALTGLAAGSILPLLAAPLMQPMRRLTASELKPTLSRRSAFLWVFLSGLFGFTFLLVPVSSISFDLLATAAGAGLALFLSNFVIAAAQTLWRDNRDSEVSHESHFHELFPSGFRFRRKAHGRASRTWL